MTSYYDVCERWCDRALGNTAARQIDTQRVWADGDHIYSYGRHFEMARIVRNAKNRKPLFFLINGDRFSVTTSGHQSHVRGAIGRTEFDSVIIPYGALEAASIDFSSMRTVHVTDDWTEYTHHETQEQPPGSVWVTEPVMEYVDLTPDEIVDKVHKRLRDALASWSRRQGWALDEAWEDPPRDYRVWRLGEPMPTAQPLGHYHGDRSEYRQTGITMRLARSAFGRSSWQTIDVVANEDGSVTYSWETSRHWLGASLIRAKVTWDGRTPCKTCAGSGTHPDMHGPPRPNDDWETINPGDPDYVEHGGWNQRRLVYAPGERDRGFAWDENSSCDVCRGRGSKPFTRSRQAYFLSGFDSNESRPSYFFCELPRGVAPTSVDEAFEALKPEAVKLAETIGREVTRQGDIFAIQLTNIDKRALRKQGALFEKRGRLLNTNHVATEVAYLPDGVTLARGTLHHAPERRDPDHARRKLAKGWNVIMKNTVPIAA